MNWFRREEVNDLQKGLNSIVSLRVALSEGQVDSS